MSKDIKWYRLDNILKYEAQYYIIFGERSNGKSFAVDEYIIDKYFKEGKQFAFVKRFEDDVKAKYMSQIFDKKLLDYIEKEYGHYVKFYQGKWLVYPVESDGKLSDCKVFGFAFSLNSVNRTKTTQYPEVDTILFEEFMSIDCTYLNDELNLFLNLVSTIVRYRHNVKIFMLANAISKYSPYSQALNLRLHRIKKGEIITRTYTDKQGFKTKFVIERSENVNVFDNSENKEKVVYNIFGNAGVGKMITTGDFETHSYQRRVGNVTFEELREDPKDVIIGKKNRTPFVIRYEDYYYRIYILLGDKNILAFREIEEDSINKNNTLYIINGYLYKEGIVNINNLALYDDVKINGLINLIVASMRQKDFITMTDDDGENVTNAFRLSGINLI